jgi:hypothetical protein
MDLKETRVGREEIYDGIVVHLTKDTVRLPDGKTGIREVVWHRGAVCVVPVTDEGEVVLVQQFRYAMDRELWEIPAGKLEAGETDRAAAARRELEEKKVMERFANVDIHAAARRVKERADAETAEKMSDKNAKTASIYDSIDAKNVVVVGNNDRVIKTGNVARAGGSNSKKKK